MKIVSGPASVELGNKVAELLGIETVPSVFKTYPDGESYVRLEGNVKNQELVVVQTTSPPQDTRLLQLAFIADAAKRHGAKHVTAVVPYLAYVRQDRVFLEGEAVSVEAVAKMLLAAGVDGLMTVNVRENVLSQFPFPARTISAIPSLAQYFKQKGYEKAFALAPDRGALWLVEEASEILGGEFGFLDKHRDRYTGQIVTEKKILDVKGKRVIIFDDIISTGGTIVAAARIVKQLGASAVCAACVHPLLIGEAEKKIIDGGVNELAGTDAVSSHVSKVSLAPLIADALKEHGSG